MSVLGTADESSRRVPRRAFLKLAGTLGLGSAAGGLLSVACQSASAPAPKAPEAPTTAPAKPAAPAAPAAPAPAAPVASPAAAPAAPAASPAAAAPAASPAAAAKPPGDIMTANIAYGINLNSLALMVALEKGFWLKEGLDVKLKSFNSGTDATKALQIGEVQYSFSAPSNFLPAREQGIPMQIVTFDMGDQTTARSDSQLAIIALAGKGIEAGKPASLAGKKVGTQVGQTPNDYLTIVLKQAGVDPSKVEVLNIAQGDQVAALEAGRLDALSFIEPYVSEVVLKHPDAAIVTRGGGYIGYISPMTTMPETVVKQPEMTQRMVTGLVAAMQYCRKNPDDAAEIGTRYIPGMAANVAKAAVKNVPYDPRMTKQAFQTFEDVNKQLLELGKIKTSVNIQDVFVTTFMDQVQKQHPEYLSDLKPA